MVRFSSVFFRIKNRSGGGGGQMGTRWSSAGSRYHHRICVGWAYRLLLVLSGILPLLGDADDVFVVPRRSGSAPRPSSAQFYHLLRILHSFAFLLTR